MNDFANTKNTGLLKNVYRGKGPISQMNDIHPQIHAIRKRRDLAKLK